MGVKNTGHSLSAGLIDDHNGIWVLRPFTAESPGYTKVHQRGIYSSFFFPWVTNGLCACVSALIFLLQQHHMPI